MHMHMNVCIYIHIHLSIYLSIYLWATRAECASALAASRNVTGADLGVVALEGGAC